MQSHPQACPGGQSRIAPWLTWCSISFSPGLPWGCSAGFWFWPLGWLQCKPALLLLIYYSTPLLPLLFLLISSIPPMHFSLSSSVLPLSPSHLAIHPLYLDRSQLHSDASHPSPSLWKCNMKCHLHFSDIFYLQLQTAVSRSRAEVLTTSSNTHPTWSCFKNNISLARGIAQASKILFPPLMPVEL